MVDKQPQNNQAVRKLSIPPLSKTACTTKTSKEKKTNEEKQAKKKELDWDTLQGGALEASWSAAVTDGEGPGSCTRSNFQAMSTLFSVLPTLKTPTTTVQQELEAQTADEIKQGTPIPSTI